MAARYATYIANKISMCPSKRHTVWQEYYKEQPNILTDCPFGAALTLASILLTHEQQLAQTIDDSFGPRSLTGIYLGKATIHGKEKHISMRLDSSFEDAVNKVFMITEKTAYAGINRF